MLYLTETLFHSFVPGESEMVSHEDMLFEHEIYHKLVQIRVFKQFRLWKTFCVWRTTVKRDKYERTVCFVQVAFSSLSCVHQAM